MSSGLLNKCQVLIRSDILLPDPGVNTLHTSGTLIVIALTFSGANQKLLFLNLISLILTFSSRPLDLLKIKITRNVLDHKIKVRI